MMKSYDYDAGNIKGCKFGANGPYAAVGFYLENKKILELRLSLAAGLDDRCGLKGIDVHQWIWDIGNSRMIDIEDVEGEQNRIIEAKDVEDGNLNKKITDLKEFLV
ncbi:hypothetical protein [Bacillus toyonensis]|uniref:hypothetical protein n=1 Tax=Bacillus toyonensis TaxID=155322 RepID=UPI00119D94B6|nr:hypothetical protein [Bacillus toyonensis]